MAKKKTKKNPKRTTNKNKHITVKKSAKPVTLEQIRKKAIKKDRTGLKLCTEINFIIAQEKDFGTEWKFIFDGSAIVEGKYVSDFLLGGHTQKKGQLVYLNGVSKQIGDKYWSPNGAQVCDGNLVAWNCMGGTMIYNK